LEIIFSIIRTKKLIQ